MANSVEPDLIAFSEQFDLGLLCSGMAVRIFRVNMVCALMLRVLGKSFSRQHFEIVFLFFPENRL